MLTCLLCTYAILDPIKCLNHALVELVAPSPRSPHPPPPRLRLTRSDGIICMLNTTVTRSSELVLGGAHGPALRLLHADGRDFFFCHHRLHCVWKGSRVAVDAFTCWREIIWKRGGDRTHQHLLPFFVIYLLFFSLSSDLTSPFFQTVDDPAKSSNDVREPSWNR